MIKHILTTVCNRKCPYCITRNIRTKQVIDFHLLAKNYNLLSKKEDFIMLTGGEPTMAEWFWEYVDYAKDFFLQIFLTTQNEKVLSDHRFEVFNAISFSIHDTDRILPVYLKIPIYACVMDEKYNAKLPNKLKKLGYSGLTINEEQRNGKEFTQKLPKSTKKFSIKINHKGRCINYTIILPNGEIVTDFSIYL